MTSHDVCRYRWAERDGVVLQARNLTRNQVWYAEMHAYALGAAAEGVRHAASNSTVFHVAYYHPHGEAVSSD